VAGGLFIEGAGPSTFARRCRRQFKRLGYVKKSKDSDRFSHGLNERIPVGERPSMAYLLSLFTDLSK
jgi:hypothetical protein